MPKNFNRFNLRGCTGPQKIQTRLGVQSHGALLERSCPLDALFADRPPPGIAHRPVQRLPSGPTDFDLGGAVDRRISEDPDGQFRRRFIDTPTRRTTGTRQIEGIANGYAALGSLEQNGLGIVAQALFYSAIAGRKANALHTGRAEHNRAAVPSAGVEHDKPGGAVVGWGQQ